MNNDLIFNYEIGDRIANQYEIVSELQAGTTGVVYICHHYEFYDRLTAVKLLYPCIAQDKTAKMRLREEISASYLITHPNIIRTYDFINDGDLCGYSMEYVDGCTLSEVIQKKTEIPIKEKCKMLSQICAGVSAFHRGNIIHRDLKPENIFLTKKGKIKISNSVFAYKKDSPRLTEKGGIVGTLQYSSPEYLTTGNFDFRSDIYSIGVIAYQLITGVLPLSINHLLDVINISPTKIEPIRNLVNSCPAEVERIVMKALAWNPDNRYQTAQEMLFDLENFISKKEEQKANGRSKSYSELPPNANEEINALKEIKRRAALKKIHFKDELKKTPANSNTPESFNNSPQPPEIPNSNNNYVSNFRSPTLTDINTRSTLTNIKKFEFSSLKRYKEKTLNLINHNRDVISDCLQIFLIVITGICFVLFW